MWKYLGWELDILCDYLGYLVVGFGLGVFIESEIFEFRVLFFS